MTQDIIALYPQSYHPFLEWLLRHKAAVLAEPDGKMEDMLRGAYHCSVFFFSSDVRRSEMYPSDADYFALWCAQNNVDAPEEVLKQTSGHGWRMYDLTRRGLSTKVYARAAMAEDEGLIYKGLIEGTF